MNNEIILQIFSGGYSGEASSYEAVEKKLLSVLPRLPAGKAIMGWAPDRALYEKTAELLAKWNIEFYLWFPVFSETGTIRSLDPLVDIWGKNPSMSRDSSAIKGSEDFSFCCPNNPLNVEKIIDIYESEFSSIPFSGIFLDKIRYPSFGQESGLSSVFSCFCPHCRSEYEKENFDFVQLKDDLSRLEKVPLGITAYRGNGYYEFEDHSISDFFSLKSAFIYRELKRLCAYFRGKGLKTGFDVFAPFLSNFVGQDLPKLSGLCDFMKPMMYRITNAPAGLPFELEAFLRETGCNEPQSKRRFYDILGFDSSKKIFDPDFAVKELAALNSASSCPIYAGIEINRKRNIAEVSPEYIEETMKAYAGAGIRGFTLSWDLLEAPEENIVKVIEMKNRM